MASESSCELVEVKASKTSMLPGAPRTSGIGHDGIKDLTGNVVMIAAERR